MIQALAYADVFDFPLTKEEIIRWLIFKDDPVVKKPAKKVIVCLIDGLAERGKIKTDGNYFCLTGRSIDRLVVQRRQREADSFRKLRIAQRVADWLRLIPTVKMIAITGALAMNNAGTDDDIDLLIVSNRNRLWLTRLLTTVMIELTGKRRHPREGNVKDKICVNMFMDESDMAVPDFERDLYIAHEVCQLKPLWQKEGTYTRFLTANKWVERYLPNGLELSYQRVNKAYQRNFIPIIDSLFDLLEIVAFRFQLWYMKSKRTIEVVESHRVRFHPNDCRKWVLAKYHKVSQASLEKLPDPQ